MRMGRLGAAVTAQILAQILAGWTMLLQATHWPEISVLALVSLLAAILVPFRHDGSLKDRATGNFGAGAPLEKKGQKNDNWVLPHRLLTKLTKKIQNFFW